MTVRLNALTVLAADPARLASFWGDLLGWSRSGATLAGSPFGLVFVPSDEPVRLPAQAHLHLTSNDCPQEETVARALALGASHVDVGQQPDEGHVVLAAGRARCGGRGAWRRRRDGRPRRQRVLRTAGLTAARAAEAALGPRDQGPEPPHVRAQAPT